MNRIPFIHPSLAAAVLSLALVPTLAGAQARVQYGRITNVELADLVHLSPPRFGQDKLAAFQSADIFIYPSFHEGVPMAVLEAMSAGLPVIATRVGGLPDVVQDRLTGILIDPGQPQQLAAAILALVNQADLRLAMGAAGRRLAEERYSLESHVHQLVDIYQKVLDSGKRS